MKKILAIALTLTLVFALAVSSSAALATTWTEIEGGPAWGTVSVEADGSIKMVGDGGGFSQAGVLYGSKVPVDGLELKLKVANATAPGQISAAAIVYLSGAAIENSFTPEGDNDSTHNIFAGNSYSVMCDTTKTAAYVIAPQDGTVAKIHGGIYSLLVSELGLGWDNASLATVDYAEFTIKFEVEGDKVELYVNGTKVEGYGLDKANIVDADGKAYLAVTTNGYGTAVQDVTLVTVNGTAANAFVPAAPVGPADIEVVAIAGAMIVALMAAAFVVKARKA
ncbi:MAG: hypothetical protein IKA51_06520 [Clostridia bacterium]|nr:hypothetical protein [Clostridia bacterium]